MNYEIYCIRDRITGIYGGLVLHVNKAAAQRWFGDIVAKEPHGMDYDLFCLGEYDSETGIINAADPYFVSNVSTLQKGSEG